MLEIEVSGIDMTLILKHWVALPQASHKPKLEPRLMWLSLVVKISTLLHWSTALIKLFVNKERAVISVSML